jgi:hypothetical protein
MSFGAKSEQLALLPIPAGTRFRSVSAAKPMRVQSLVCPHHAILEAGQLSSFLRQP